MHENQLVAAGGDGCLKLFDTSLEPGFPVRAWQGAHAREIFCVHWNLVGKDSFLSSSWDGTVKIWRPELSGSGDSGGAGGAGGDNNQPVATLATQTCTYSAQFSPHARDILSCVGSDSMLRMYDLRVGDWPVVQFAIHDAAAAGGTSMSGHVASQPSEALTLDWNKYRDSVLAAAGVDRTIRTFDVRKPASGPLSTLLGHEYAIRKITWSPHKANVLLSASYDMTCRVWVDEGADSGMEGAGVIVGKYGAGKDGMPPISSGGRESGRMGRHTEFVTGVDWCLFGVEGWCASTGWDERVLIWNAAALMT